MGNANIPRIWSWDYKKNVSSKTILSSLMIPGTILIFWLAQWISEMIVNHLSIGNPYSTLGKFAPIFLFFSILFIFVISLFIVLSFVYSIPKSQLYQFTLFVWGIYLVYFAYLTIKTIPAFLFRPQEGFHVSFSPPGDIIYLE